MANETRTRGASSSELHSDARQFYEQYWNLGSQVSRTTAERNEALIHAVFPSPPQGQKILEIGVGGEGGLLLGLRDGNAVCGLDASASGVDGCSRLGVPARLFDADREPIPFPDNYFDVALAFEVMEHLSNPQYAIDEIRRALKPGGRFIASTPSLYIHHWPRLFYPSLFSRGGFRDFLLANRFWLVQELGMGNNIYAPILKEPKERAWSIVWVCDNIKADTERLVEAGKYFLGRRDDEGMRIAPIEAADMFRAALLFAPQHLEALGGLALALVYRALVGEHDELSTVIRKFEDALASTDHAVVMAAYFHLVLLQAEMQRFGKSVLPDDDCLKMISAVSRTDSSAGEALTRMLGESRDFAARILSRHPRPPGSTDPHQTG